MADLDKRAAAVTSVLQASDGKSAEVTQQALDLLPKPSVVAVDYLWKLLVFGLLVILIVALAGVIALIADGNDKTDPAIALTIFTTTLAGLLGLFAPSPAESNT
jgi:hypothetical protein